MQYIKTECFKYQGLSYYLYENFLQQIRLWMTVNIYMKLFTTDPFADDHDVGAGSSGDYVHIRIQQRNGRKTLTTVQGIPPEYDFKKIVKACKKVCFKILGFPIYKTDCCAYLGPT